MRTNVSENLPAESVNVPLLRLLKAMDTNGIGSSDWRSVMMPESVVLCAETKSGEIPANKTSKLIVTKFLKNILQINLK